MNRLQVLSLFFSYAVAVPNPQTGVGVFPLPNCDPSYTITDQHTFEGDFVTGDYTVGGGKISRVKFIPAEHLTTILGGELNTGSSFSVGVTVTVGADISISEIVGLGLDASVSKTTTKEVSQGAGGACPTGPWKCALAVYPLFLLVAGQKHFASNSQCYTNGTAPPEPYKAKFPVEGDSGGVKSRVEVCACKNFEHWADNGAPSIACEGCA